MRAALLHADRRLEIAEIDETRADGWALIRTKAAGVCGTELHFLDGMVSPPNFPFVLGHELAGVVVDAPNGSGLTRGDRVVVHNFVGCGRCRWCRSGRSSICCDPVGQIGFTLDGGYREFVAAPPSNLIPLPDNVDFETGAVLGCSGLTAVHSTRLAGVGLNATVVINGVGGVGVAIAQVASVMGAIVIAIADTASKADLVQEFGATETHVAKTEKDYEVLPRIVRRMTDGAGADFYFDLVGTRASIDAGLASLGHAGCFVCVGYTEDPFMADPFMLMDSELRVIGSISGDRQDLKTAVQLAASGRLSVPIDRRYSLDELPVAIERLRRREVHGRGVIVW